uniref:Uncharacterized protein n=1 Tax=Anopheles minimus TaxID=112268 RepID=A0A182WNV6_9DIPT
MPVHNLKVIIYSNITIHKCSQMLCTVSYRQQIHSYKQMHGSTLSFEHSQSPVFLIVFVKKFLSPGYCTQNR